MNLVFVTRIVDRADTRSGFIFDWIDALAEEVDELHVICLNKGDTSGLPQNVHIGSMGKDKGAPKIAQLLNYVGLLMQWAPGSQGILCHMHPIYAIVAFPFAKLFGRKLGLWYTHKQVDEKLRLAHRMVDVVFTASPESFRLKSKKKRVVGHGINIERFARTTRSERSDGVFQVVSLGRISPVKDYETLVKAAEEFVKDEGREGVRFDIYGDPATATDESYLESLLEMVDDADLDEVVSFHPGVPYGQVPNIYERADVFVNLSTEAGLDKTVLEAAASKTLVLAAYEGFRGAFTNISPLLIADSNEPKMVSSQLQLIKSTSQSEKEQIIQRLYAWVKENHDLTQLAKRIVGEYSNNSPR